MKQFFLIAAIALLVISCTKDSLSPFSLNPQTNLNWNEKPGLSDNYFTISAKISDMANTPQPKEVSNAISLPINRSMTLNLSSPSRQVKDVVWKVNEKTIANGNNANATLTAMSVGTLSVAFTEVESGKKHDKKIKLYAFKQMFLSVSIQPNVSVCGKVAIGVGQQLGSFNERIEQSYITASQQDICTGKTNSTARIARIPFSIYDPKTTISIDLIEPKEQTTNNSVSFCLLFFCLSAGGKSTYITPMQVYQTVTFNPAATSNCSPGSYTLNGTKITLEP